MKKLIICNIIIFLMTVGILFGSQWRVSSADENAKGNYKTMIPFAMRGGSVGFFDQSTGVVSVYDPSLNELIRKVKMSGLGL